MPSPAKRLFQFGDYVVLASAAARAACPFCTLGVVVNYAGRVQQGNPRVRWSTGWASTIAASGIRLASLSERGDTVIELKDGDETVHKRVKHEPLDVKGKIYLRRLAKVLNKLPDGFYCQGELWTEARAEVFKPSTPGSFESVSLRIRRWVGPTQAVSVVAGGHPITDIHGVEIVASRKPSK